MKWLVYVLILVNLGIFVWHYQGLDNQPVQSDLYDQSTRLVLLKEYRERQDNEQSDHDGGDQTVCYSLGPFAKKAPADNALAEFSKEKIQVWKRTDSDAIRTGYWVFLPPAESRQQAKRSLAKLRQIKEKDYFLVATGQMKNAVSLGLFSKAKLAKARVKEINKKGFNAKVDKITLPKRVYWLDWEKQASKQPSENLLDSLRAQFKGIGQTERRCSPNKAN